MMSDKPTMAFAKTRKLVCKNCGADLMRVEMNPKRKILLILCPKCEAGLEVSFLDCREMRVEAKVRDMK